MSENSPKITPRADGDWKLTVFVCVLIIAAVGGVAYVVFETEPTAKKSSTSKKTAMLVSTQQIAPQTWTPHLEAVGVVRPVQDLVLQPQIAGRVVWIAPEFEIGRFISKGDVLMRLESADWRNTLAQRESALDQMRAELVIEQGRQGAAKAEYDYLTQQLEGTERALVMREPQLESAQARVRAAEAAVKQARLDLGRVTVRAPFDAHIVRRDVNVGSQVSANDSLGRLLGTERHWIAIDLPSDKLRWLAIPRDNTPGSEVHVRSRTWPEGVQRTAHVHSLVSMLEETTRMARVMAVIEDPLARGESTQHPLLVGEFLEVSIVGEPLEQTFRVSREWLRSGETIWLMRDEKLHIAEVEVLLEDATHAYVASGLKPGDQIVTTSIATPTQGAPLRLEQEEQTTTPDAAKDAGATDE